MWYMELWYPPSKRGNTTVVPIEYTNRAHYGTNKTTQNCRFNKYVVIGSVLNYSYAPISSGPINLHGTYGFVVPVSIK